MTNYAKNCGTNAVSQEIIVFIMKSAFFEFLAFYWQGVHNSTTDPRTLGGGHGSSNATNGAEGSNAYLVCRLARTRKTQACLHAAATRASATRSTSSSSGSIFAPATAATRATARQPQRRNGSSSSEGDRSANSRSSSGCSTNAASQTSNTNLLSSERLERPAQAADSLPLSKPGCPGATLSTIASSAMGAALQAKLQT